MNVWHVVWWGLAIVAVPIGLYGLHLGYDVFETFDRSLECLLVGLGSGLLGGHENG